MKELATELGLKFDSSIDGAEVEESKPENSNTEEKEEQKEKIQNINVQAVKDDGPKGGEGLGSQQVQVVQTDSGEILLVTCEAGQEREAAGLAYDDEVILVNECDGGGGDGYGGGDDILYRWRG